MPVAAIVLAAGRSERMGAFKPLLPFGNSTVISSCVSYLRNGGVEQIVVVVGHRSDEIKQHLEGEPVSFALNAHPTNAMSESVVLGVAELASPAAVLIAPADHPAVTPGVVRQLIGEWSNGAKLVIPTWNHRGGHPVLIDFGYRDELVDLDPKLGLKSFFQRHQSEVVRLEVNCSFVARDMDTWDDYVKLHFDSFGVVPGGLANG
jgi:molybdenum cofactor cytidylyltransferase